MTPSASFGGVHLIRTLSAQIDAGSLTIVRMTPVRRRGQPSSTATSASF